MKPSQRADDGSLKSERSDPLPHVGGCEGIEVFRPNMTYCEQLGVDWPRLISLHKRIVKD
ncbi:MAG: hypothetical protein JWQ71_3690 [Pedosphaera sp.]|nr:hypothetical protein [Pedosphaera sp.]